MYINNRTKIFFDTEFTGLHKDTGLLSIGLVSENGRRFYAELNDYDRTQITPWLEENVMAHMQFPFATEIYPKGLVQFMMEFSMKGSTELVAGRLKQWLEQFGEVEMWSDCLAYDWVLFNNLFGTAFDIPKNVYYIPFDICTLFELKGIDPDIGREEFARTYHGMAKHNALHDALIIRDCYNKLMSLPYPESVE